MSSPSSSSSAAKLTPPLQYGTGYKVVKWNSRSQGSSKEKLSLIWTRRDGWCLNYKRLVQDRVIPLSLFSTVVSAPTPGFPTERFIGLHGEKVGASFVQCGLTLLPVASRDLATTSDEVHLQAENVIQCQKLVSLFTCCLRAPFEFDPTQHSVASRTVTQQAADGNLVYRDDSDLGGGLAEDRASAGAGATSPRSELEGEGFQLDSALFDMLYKPEERDAPPPASYPILLSRLEGKAVDSTSLASSERAALQHLLKHLSAESPASPPVVVKALPETQLTLLIQAAGNANLTLTGASPAINMNVNVLYLNGALTSSNGAFSSQVAPAGQVLLGSQPASSQSGAPASSVAPRVQHDLRSLSDGSFGSTYRTMYRGKMAGFDRTLFDAHAIVDLTCDQCNQVLSMPLAGRGCSHVFCKNCITDVVNCPMAECADTDNCSPIDHSYVKQALQKKIAALTVRCEHGDCPAHLDGFAFGLEGAAYEQHLSNLCERTVACPYHHGLVVARKLQEHVDTVCPKYYVRCGCQMELPRELVEKHQQDDCVVTMVPCGFNCKEQRVMRSSLRLHESKCDLRPVSCPHCTMTGIRYNELALHYQKCDTYPAKCEHCSAEVKRGNLTLHYEVCSEYPVKCPYDNCTMPKMPRSQLAEHMEQSVVSHLRLATLKIESQGIQLLRQGDELLRLAKEMSDLRSGLDLHYVSSKKGDALTDTLNAVEGRLKVVDAYLERLGVGARKKKGQAGKERGEEKEEDRADN